MRGPIEARIAALRNQVRRVLALHGLSWVVVGVVAAVFVATLLDWAIDLVPEVRLALLLGVGGVALSLFLLRVVRPLIVRFADLDIALRIEERWPGLNDRLASTIQFLRINEATEAGIGGSRALREATVRQTLAEVEEIDFRQTVDPRPARWMLGWATGAIALGGLVIALEPTLSGIALRRLGRPFGGESWPRLTHLAVRAETPRKLARGMTFPLVVGVGQRDRMPSSGRVTYRFADGETRTEPLRVGDDRTFRGRIESVAGPFSFTVEAGDDRTEAVDVAVVPPPTLDDLAVQLIAPDYTRLPPQTLAAGNTQVRALEGTVIEVAGRANKALAHAELHRGDLAAEPAQVLADGRGVAARFTVTKSQPFWVELTDTEGFRSQEFARFDLRSLADEPPRVTIDEPSHDRDVPATAVVPIALGIEDDYGIGLVRLVYKVATGGSEASRDGVIPLWAPPEPAPGAKVTAAPIRRQPVTYRWDLATLPGLTPGTVITVYGEARDFDNRKGPNLGKSREIHLRIVSKEDADRLLEDQQRAIREEIDRIAAIQRQAKTPVDDALRTFSRTDKLAGPLREEVRNAEAIQRQVNNRITNPTDGLDQKLRQFQEDSANFRADNGDAVRQMADLRAGVERVKDRNLGPAEQALARANKQLDRPGTEPNEANKPQEQTPKQDTAKGGEAKAPAAVPPGEPKPAGAPRAGDPAQPTPGDPPQGNDAQPANETKPGEQGTSKAASKSGSAPPNEAKPTNKANPGSPEKPGESQPGGETKPKGGQPESKPALVEAEKNQQAIADELAKMLAGLGQFDTVRTAAKEAKALLEQQEEAIRRAAEAAKQPDMAGRAAEALTPEQKANLGNIAAGQNEIAKGLQNLEGRMDEMAKQLDPTDPLGASALREAAAQSRKKATAAKMGQTAENLDKNRMGQAQTGQQQARRDLKDLVDAIQDRRSRELSRLVADLKAAEADLKKLRDRQTANLKATQKARANADPKQRADELRKLAKEQQQLQDEAKKQVQRLAKLNAEAGAKAGDQAAGAMAQAKAGMEQDQGDQAEENEEEALKNLREAQAEVAQARQEAEDQLAMEQIAKMTDALKSLAERQDKMVTETAQYEKVRVDNGGKLTLAQRNGVRESGRVEAGLRDEVTELVDRLGGGTPVFGLTLKKAGTAMDTAAERLGGGKTDEPTAQAVRTAANRLRQLVDSLKPDKGNGAGQGNAGEGQGQGQGQPQRGGDGIPAIAQLKVLKLLQQELNERTDAFDEIRRRQPELSPDQTAELDRLHEDQGNLADLVRDMTRPRKDDGE